MCSGRITPLQKVYIKKPPRKTDSGSVLCRIQKLIKQKIDIVTSTDGTNSFLYVVNP